VITTAIREGNLKATSGFSGKNEKGYEYKENKI
jgi:hypothetical protein